MVLPADILFGVGAAAAITGVVLLLTADSGDETAAGAPRLGLAPRLHGAAVTLGGAF